jgi:hypothetical protein
MTLSLLLSSNFSGTKSHVNLFSRRIGDRDPKISRHVVSNLSGGRCYQLEVRLYEVPCLIFYPDVGQLVSTYPIEYGTRFTMAATPPFPRPARPTGHGTLVPNPMSLFHSSLTFAR